MRVPFGALCVCALVATAAHAQEAHAPVPPRLVQSNPVVADVAREPVSVVVTLDATGGVTETALVASTGDEALDTRLLEAVRAFVFEPARVDGAAVPARITVQVQIVLPAIESVEAATPEEPAEPSDADPSDADAVAPSEPAPEAAPDAVEPAPEAELDADDEGFGAEARVEAAALRATGRGASDVEISRDVLEAAPAAEGADLLRRAPGVYVARAEGDAVGHRIFLRGFDAEHGQDVELRVAGIPMNLPSHLHGQGYLDLGFLIPEVVDSMRVLEGVADPRQGDFAVAGTVELELGVRRRGLTSRTSGGSFGSFRQLVLWAPEEQRDGSFAAFQMRRTDGFGDNRNALSGSAIVQQVLGDGPWRHRLFVLAHGSRARLAGFLRRDDVQAGRVGFYESYDYPTAEAQSGLAMRGVIAYEATNRQADGGNTQLGLWIGHDVFRLQANYTGFVERSRTNPDWVGRGDLVEQQNRTSSIGANARWRSRVYRPISWVNATVETGLSARLDAIDQAQRLIQAPQNTTWDERVDATIHAADVGVYLDLDLAVTDWVELRGGVRADVLFYEVDDRLGNFIPDFREDSYLLGYRRSAFGVAASPRASLTIKPTRFLSVLGSYGEGFRSPQARTLEDGETAPFSKVRSADAGVRLKLDDVVEARLVGYWTRLSDDVAFDPAEGRLERVGATRRAGGVLHVVTRPTSWLVGSMSVTYVDAELLEPPPPSADDPRPAFTKGQNLPYVPPWVVRADVGVQHALSPQLGRHPLRGRAGVGLTYLSPRPLPYSAEASPFTVIDASAGFGWGPVELSLDVYNLFDARYAAVELSYASNWDPEATRSRVPARHTSAGAPRTFFANLEVRF
ncbi:MAG: TonB-dependent receptor [Sandaracinus sp.]|nr:TonB-dependent receptor [Sandaracinus sp.]